MTASTPIRTYTVEEYLTLEVDADTRSEFYRGAITGMAGGTPEHNEIASVANMLLRLGLKGQSFSVFVADQRLWIPTADMLTYPDIMVPPRPPMLKPGRKDTVVNPIFIAEVLSDSTEAYDRGEKFAAYRTIDTLQEYLLIDKYRTHVEQYVKQAEQQWLFTEYNGFDKTAALASVQVEISLTELYEAVT